MSFIPVLASMDCFFVCLFSFHLRYSRFLIFHWNLSICYHVLSAGFLWSRHLCWLSSTHSGKSRLSSTLFLTDESTSSVSLLGLHGHTGGEGPALLLSEEREFWPRRGLHWPCAGAGDLRWTSGLSGWPLASPVWVWAGGTPLYSLWASKAELHMQPLQVWLRVLICFSYVWLFVTLWTVACQAPLSVGIFR